MLSRFDEINDRLEIATRCSAIFFSSLTNPCHALCQLRSCTRASALTGALAVHLRRHELLGQSFDVSELCQPVHQAV